MAEWESPDKDKGRGRQLLPNRFVCQRIPASVLGLMPRLLPFFSPGPGQFIEKVTLALQQEQNFGQTLPEFGFVFSPAAAVDNIDAEHM